MCRIYSDLNFSQPPTDSQRRKKDLGLSPRGHRSERGKEPKPETTAVPSLLLEEPKKEKALHTSHPPRIKSPRDSTKRSPRRRPTSEASDLPPPTEEFKENHHDLTGDISTPLARAAELPISRPRRASIATDHGLKKLDLPQLPETKTKIESARRSARPQPKRAETVRSPDQPPELPPASPKLLHSERHRTKLASTDTEREDTELRSSRRRPKRAYQTLPVVIPPDSDAFGNNSPLLKESIKLKRQQGFRGMSSRWPPD
jgi:hypothetical protein